MRFVAEIALLKLLAAGERQRIVASILSRAVDIPALATFIERHELGLYFLSRLEALHLAKLFPARFREQLNWQRDAQHGRRVQLSAALAALHRDFDLAGVDFILTKGLHLADQYWGGVENRFTWDLDLLVRHERLQDAVSALQRAGYRSRHTGILGSRLVRRFSHAEEFLGCGVAVDLHWIFRPRPGHRVDYDAVWQRSRNWTYGDAGYVVLSAEDTLLMLLLGIAEDVERARPNYRKLWDIYLMLRSRAVTDWEGFFQSAQRQAVARLVIAMLAITSHALQCEEEFPELQQALSDWSRGVPCSSRELTAALARGPQHPANRLWIASLQPVPTAHYLAWWTLSAPLRYLAWR